MKQLNTYIIEKLKKISSKTVKHIREKRYFPENSEDLRKLVFKLIEERGKEADLNDIDTSQIKDMSWLFAYTFLGDDFDGDISQWDVSNVEYMNNMFYNSVFTGKNSDILDWDVSNVKNMNSMFNGSRFNGDISNWNVSNVNNMGGMFEESKFNGDLSNWDVSNVTRMYHIFNDSSFKGNIDHWNVNKDLANEPLKDMFKNTPLESNPPKWHSLYGWKDPGYSIFDKKNEANIEKMLKASNTGFSVNDVDDKYKYKENGEARLFWKAWVTAALYGPLSKDKLVRKKNEIDNNAPIGTKYWDKPSSNSSVFTSWSKQERFIHVKGGLLPNKQKDWNI